MSECKDLATVMAKAKFNCVCGVSVIGGEAMSLHLRDCTGARRLMFFDSIVAKADEIESMADLQRVVANLGGPQNPNAS